MRHLIATFLLSLALAACSGTTKPSTQTGKDAAEKQTTQRTKPPEKGLVKVVYSAKATEESNRRIDDAIEAANQGRIEDAISELGTVLKGDSEAFLAAYNLAVLHDQIGEDNEAVSYYERALMIEPDFSPAMLNLIRLEARRKGDVMAIADAYVRKRPENLEHQIARLEALIAAGRTDEAVEDARIILKQDEANVRARYYMALAHFTAGRVPLAGYIAEQALKLSDTDAELHFLFGQTALAADNKIAARQAFETAVELRPDYPEAQNAVGLLYHEARNFEEAEAAFRTAIRYAPRFKEARLNLGNVMKALNRAEDAEASYLEALSISPDWADGHFSLGALYLAAEVLPMRELQGMPRLEKARDEFKLAQELWTEDADTKLAQQFAAKADKAIAILVAETELQNAEPGGTTGGDTGGAGDPFTEGGGDPFNDGPAGGADPFEDGGGADPFEDSDKDSGEKKDDSETPPPAPTPDAAVDPFESGEPAPADGAESSDEGEK